MTLIYDLLSPCVGIRRLISEFEADGRLHEYLMREGNQRNNNVTTNPSHVSTEVEDGRWCVRVCVHVCVTVCVCTVHVCVCVGV